MTIHVLNFYPCRSEEHGATHAGSRHRDTFSVARPAAPASTPHRTDNVLMPPRTSQDFDYDQVLTTSSKGDDPASTSSSSATEVCLNTTGIVVAVALFVVLQLALAFVSAHFFRRSGASQKDQDDLAIRRVFNPYTLSRK